MSDLLEDMGKALSLYHDGEDNLAHICAMKCIRTHHATIQQNAEDAKRLRAIERDAARYRWLRGRNVGDGRLYKVIHDDAQPGYQGFKCEEELDQAIDAAMQESGEWTEGVG